MTIDDFNLDAGSRARVDALMEQIDAMDMTWKQRREIVFNLLVVIMNDHEERLSADEYLMLSRFVEGQQGRTTGILIDTNASSERYELKPPVVDLSNQVMDLVDRLGNLNWHIDPRAWKQLLIYAPGYQKMKKKLKKLKILKKLL